MVLWKFTFKEMKHRPGRAILTLLSIVIGVAAVVAVSISTATTHQAYQQIYQSVAGRAALEVVAAGGGVYADDVVPMLEKTPGVEAAAPSFFWFTNVYYHEKTKILTMLLGIDPLRDKAVREYNVVEGSYFIGDDGVLLEKGFAAHLGLKVGEEIRVLTPSLKRRSLTIVGLVSPQSGLGANQAGMIFLTLAMAQRLQNSPHCVNNISIVLRPAADEKTVQKLLVGRLPKGLAAQVPAVRTAMAQQTIQQAEQGLKFAYALILSLAVIMIFNTFLMNVSERRRQLAVLRAIGTVRAQVIWLLLREGLFMGIVGTVVGSVLGVGGAILLTSVVSKSYTSTMPTMQITIWPFLLAALVGPGMSLLAMLIPAYLAGRISAMEGIRPAIAKEGARVPLSFALFGVATFIVTGSILAACVTGWLPVSWTTWAGTVFTAAFVMLVPAVLGPLTRFAALLLRPLLGLEGRLAQRQVLRRRTRTTLTIGVLYIAISSGIALGTTLINSVDDLRGWLNDTFQGDFTIRDPSGDLSSAHAIVLPESLGTELRAVPGVENVDAIRMIDARVNDVPVKVVVREYARQTHLPLHLQEGRPADVRRRMLDGEVAIGSVLANRTGTALGQEVTMDTSEGTKRFRVAGITTEYLQGGLLVHMERSAGKRLLGVEGVNVFVLKADIHALDDVRARLKTLCDKNDLHLQSFSELRVRTDAIANGIIGSLWGLLGLGFVVAAFGIANTLTMNVLEQTRELAMLRVVAMTRAQVRKTILAQATIIGAIGLVTGSIGGMVGAYVTSLCSKAVLGQAVDFSLHMGLVAMSAMAAMVIILVAAWIPSERAARLNLLLALKYE